MKKENLYSPTLLRRPEVERRTGLSRSTLYKMMSQEQFPRPISLYGRTVAWSSKDISAWINKRIAESSIGEIN